MMRSRIIGMICVLIAAAVFFTGCAHPWRIAPNPYTAAPVTEEPSDLPVDTDEPETAEPTDTDEPTADPTEAASIIPDTEAPATDELPTESSATPEPTGSVTTAPTNTPTAAPVTNTPTAAPTPTPTPKPTPTPAPTPTPSPTPKPADIPPFSAPTINGHGTITNSVFSTARVTMVNVWATTCGPCIQEMPHIQQLANNYASRGLKVISVLGDSETPGCIQQGLNIINGIGFTLPVLRNNASVAAAFPAGAYPMTYFIDSNGNILRVEAASHTYDQWVSIVNGLLG